MRDEVSGISATQSTDVGRRTPLPWDTVKVHCDVSFTHKMQATPKTVVYGRVDYGVGIRSNRLFYSLLRVMARIKAENRIDTTRSRYTGVKMLYIVGNVEVQCRSYAYFVKQKKGLKISIKRIMTLSLRKIYPSFLVKKIGAVISEQQRIEIAEKWELFKKTGAKPSQKKHLGRGTSFRSVEKISKHTIYNKRQ
ncbi:hypothetical protein F5887DRAFT_274678 [Amanita rubescens]|nr:hypothetical protein F5887DRAFT_274678 [Amanita rubescens]